MLLIWKMTLLENMWNRLISFGGGVVECHNQSLKNNESSDNKQTKSHSGITMEFLSKHGF